MVKWLKNLFRNLRGIKFQKRLRTLDPERLHSRKRGNAYSKYYNKLKRTYEYGGYGGGGLWEAQKKLNMMGKRVKYWKLVKSEDNFINDEYIPIFYKRRKHRRK